ncbi:hypothetical protein QF035_009034 [Streptomyces umbrinus]|uniref:IrrE N-terminal-like domain-containing protein n=1 Tax=Streptomyces umbrinus TaxID=67370 RepID=A0ABU0T729_9ACTN|nr:hypothetical protein [Streptomyces umbrinus]MDQ1031452.1 hypothetical protein [Streptomyces umbrinus]
MDRSVEPHTGRTSLATDFGNAASLRHRAAGPVSRIEDTIHSHRRELARDRARVRRVVSKLKLPQDPGIQDVVAAAEQLRGREILRLDHPLPPGLSGFCFELPDQDVLIGTTRKSERYRTHVRAHEIGHLVMDDEQPGNGCSINSHGFLDLDAFPLDQLALPADVVKEVLTRPVHLRTTTTKHLTDPVERPAETFALEILSLLRFDARTRGTGPINSALAHRSTTL